ncbi:hypothetical protein MICRO116_150011 [Micrococcus sp. 116]|nr:hypothetical protein MICRO116_150011 [Micrococcus sp. 116]
MASTTTQTGKPAGHQWAVLMATSGKKHWPPMGRTQWPLTHAEQNYGAGRAQGVSDTSFNHVTPVVRRSAGR